MFLKYDFPKEVPEPEYDREVRKYVEQEFEYTIKELDAFYNCDEEDKGWPEKERLRQDLLNKRKLFRRYWNIKYGIYK